MIEKMSGPEKIQKIYYTFAKRRCCSKTMNFMDSFRTEPYLYQTLENCGLLVNPTRLIFESFVQGPCEYYVGLLYTTNKRVYPFGMVYI